MPGDGPNPVVQPSHFKTTHWSVVKPERRSGNRGRSAAVLSRSGLGGRAAGKLLDRSAVLKPLRLRTAALRPSGYFGIRVYRFSVEWRRRRTAMMGSTANTAAPESHAPPPSVGLQPSVYRGSFASTSSDHASIPPRKQRTFVKPWPRKYAAASSACLPV